MIIGNCAWDITKLRSYSSKGGGWKLALDCISDRELVFGYLFVEEGSFEWSETYPVCFTHTTFLLILVSVSFDHLFDQIATDLSDDSKQIVWVVIGVDPHRDILKAAWIFAKLLEVGYFSWFELVQKTFIFRPEQPHIWNLEQKHRKSLQAKTSSPPSFIPSAAPLQHFLM